MTKVFTRYNQGRYEPLTIDDIMNEVSERSVATRLVERLYAKKIIDEEDVLNVLRLDGLGGRFTVLDADSEWLNVGRPKQSAPKDWDSRDGIFRIERDDL